MERHHHQQQQLNPEARAALQSQPSAPTATDDWEGMMQRIMALTARNPEAFRQQPQANRFSAILEAVVPSRPDPTHEKVLAIVNALADAGAIRPDEGGQIYSALLQRVSRYNSTNVQTNLDRLVTDVKEAVAQRERFFKEGNLGSMVALNAFLSSLPANVVRGQEDYTAFLSALRLMVAEVPQSEVYQSGPHYFFQTSRQGLQTVNLTRAFENLAQLWGVKAPVGGDRSTISSLLTPNTRLLLLLIAPFTDSGLISRDSYIGHLLTLYREAIGQSRVDESTFQEITNVSRALGQEDPGSLQATLNFLLTQKRQRIPLQYELSPEEERVLRYVQQSVSLYLMREGASPTAALDLTAANLEPSFYASHRAFINRLMDYLHRAAAINPDYFTNAILNPHWLPPQGFYTGEFDLPEANDGFLWDDIDSSLVAKKEGGDEQSRRTSLADLGAASSFPSLGSLFDSSSSSASSSRRPSSSTGRVTRPRLPGEEEYLRDPLLQPSRNKNFPNNGVETLVDKLRRWKTYAQEQRELTQGARPRDPRDDSAWHQHRRQQEFDEDAASDSSVLDLGGSGNPFAHLMPRGGGNRRFL
ncbi:pIIIa [Squirrel monkey adenovirus]|nr:pIIIa [Squirrel monkey adenovirus]